MKIANHTFGLERRFGALGAVRMNCEAGFEAIDYSMYTADMPIFDRGGGVLAREMRRVAASYGVVFNQIHAPYSNYKRGEENRDFNRAVFRSVVRSLEIASELGASVAVVHPTFICPYLTADERYLMNMEMYSALLPRAKYLGVKIAIENMWGRHRDCPEKIVKDVCSDADELIRYVDGVGDASVVACLDVGHAGLVGEAPDRMVAALGSRIGAVHLHDNDFLSDAHTLPYLGQINYPSLIRALRRVGYSGDVTLEANLFLDTLPDELIPTSLAFMRGVAGYIRDEIKK